VTVFAVTVEGLTPSFEAFDFMHRIWLMFDPRRVLVAMVGFLAVLALVIHFILLSSQRYSWIENGTLGAEQAPVGASAPAAAAEMSPLPPGR
jgi:light-harvesting complex 1 alpha chain